MNRSCYLVEEMPCPDDLSSLRRHVPYNWRLCLGVLVELLLYIFQLSGVGVQYMVILVGEIVLKRLTLEDILELCQELQ